MGRWSSIKYYFDELYSMVFIRYVQGTIATVCDVFDRWILQRLGIGGLLGRHGLLAGRTVRLLQTGSVSGAMPSSSASRDGDHLLRGGEVMSTAWGEKVENLKFQIGTSSSSSQCLKSNHHPICSPLICHSEPFGCAQDKLREESRSLERRGMITEARHIQFRTLDYPGGEQGMKYEKYIVRDPKICGGDPAIKGTRVTVRTILASLAEGASIEEILADFLTLKERAVRAVIAFAAASAEEDLPVSSVPEIA